MKSQILKFIALIALLTAVGFSSCAKSGEDSANVTENVTGTIIGSYYYGGSASLLVQVDKKYPIGKTIEYEYVNTSGNCMQLPKGGVYKNMIQVQPSLPFSDWSENTEIINKRISFSYREYRRPEEGENDGDHLLFIIAFVFTNGMCPFPDVPKYVITECQIIK